MCGIAGIYLFDPADANLPPRDEIESFIDGLLKGIEHRGRDATGVVALQRASTQPHLEKADTEASTFVKWRQPLPEQSRIVLCHTRAATKGSPSNLDNNHPVVHKTCYVTHNGHIRNDDELFEQHKLDRIAQVDSEIIPALIDKHGLDKVHLALQELEGGFAIAAVQPEKHPDTLVLAKGRNSPLVYLQTPQGLIWASTRTAIQDAWKAVWGKTPEVKLFEELKEGELLLIEDGEIEKLEFKVRQYVAQSKTTTTSYGGYGGYDGGAYVGGTDYTKRFLDTKRHRSTCKCGHSLWKHSGYAEPYGLCLKGQCRCTKYEFARFLTKREWRRHEDYKRVQETRKWVEQAKAEERKRQQRIKEAEARRQSRRDTYVDSLGVEVKGRLRIVYESASNQRLIYDDGKLVATQFRCDGCDAYRPTKGRAKLGGYVLCVECWGEECDLCGAFFDPQALKEVEVGSDVTSEKWFLCSTCYNEANVADDKEFETAEQKVQENKEQRQSVGGVSRGQSEGLVVDDMAVKLAAEELGSKAPFLYELLFDLDKEEIAQESWLEQAYLVAKPIYQRTLAELRSGLPSITSKALALRGSEDSPRSVGEAVSLGGESPVGSESECGVRVFEGE